MALGYNAQPPLYFWLQWGMFQIAGEGVLALALLKALLLWGGAASLSCGWRDGWTSRRRVWRCLRWACCRRWYGRRRGR